MPKQPIKDPKGGLTAAGREYFKKTEGANLKPGVTGAADTPEKQKRKGSFLRRHFANPNAGPLEDAKGKPTRHALSAQAWGESVPKTDADVKKLAQKGSELLEQYHESQGGAKTPKAKTAAKKANPAAKGATAPPPKAATKGKTTAKKDAPAKAVAPKSSRKGSTTKKA